MRRDRWVSRGVMIEDMIGDNTCLASTRILLFLPSASTRSRVAGGRPIHESQDAQESTYSRGDVLLVGHDAEDARAGVDALNNESVKYTVQHIA